MKAKNFSFVIAFMLLFSMVFSMFATVKADTTYDYNNTYFDYDVAVGDSFEYNVLFNFNFSASNSFYTEMDSWLATQAEAENVSLGDFHLETFINDLETFLNMDYKMKFEITHMYEEIYNYTYYGGDYETRYTDIINGSLRADLNKGDSWQTPEVVAVDKLEDYKVFMSNYLNGSDYDDFEAQIDEIINETQDPENQPDWDNLDFLYLRSTYYDYYSNGTLMEDTPEQLENGTTEPAQPFNDFGGIEGLPIIMPNEMSFEDQYDYLTDSFKFQLLYDLEKNYTIDPFVSTDTLQTVLADAGVSSIYVDPKAVAIVWNIDDVDEDLLEDALGDNFTNELAAVGIAGYEGSVSFGLEYDDNWALNTFALYVHMGLTLDTNGLTYTDPDPPELTNEDVSIDITYTISRDGVAPPSEDDIANGQVGENSAFEIPGYPIWAVGLFGLISVVALVIKRRK